jgi:hypothetical protein
MTNGFYIVTEYVANGRHLKEVSLEKLAEDWLTTLVDVADDPGDLLARARLNDLVSEFDLRCKTPPPYRRIGHQYIRAVDDAIEVLRKEHPETYAAAQQQRDIYADKMRVARNDAFRAEAQQETWRSLGEVAQRIVNQAAEALRRNQLSSPSIVPSECNPDDRDCLPTSPTDERA